MYLYLFNPQANRGRAKKLKKRIIRCLKNLDIMGEFIELKKINEISSIIKKINKNKTKIVAAIGGDGIINEIVQKLAGEDMTLGIIPVGETNLLANILGIENWRKGCENIINGKTINMDLGIIDNRYFTSFVEIENKEKKDKKILGFMPFKKTKKYYPVSLNITLNNNDIKLQTNISSILISTIPIPIPSQLKLEEVLTDQKLHIVVKSKAQSNSQKRKKGNGDELTVLEGNVIKIRPKNSSINVRADGEDCGKTPVDIKVVPTCLKVIAPQSKS